MTLPVHLYDPHGWTELTGHDKKGRPANAPTEGKVDIRQRNDVIAQERDAAAIDWTMHSPPRSYDPVAFRFSQRL